MSHHRFVLSYGLLKIGGFRNHVNQVGLAFLLQRLAQQGQVFLLLLRHVVDVVQVGIKGGVLAVIAEYQRDDNQRPKSV